MPGAEELALSEIQDGPEDIGLDTETGVVDPFEVPIDGADDASMLEDGTLDDNFVELDAEGEEEGGWLEGSEGSGALLADDSDGVDDDDETHSTDDGGLEGVDDPMLDGLTDEEDLPRLRDEDDDLSDDFAEELLRDIIGEQDGQLLGSDDGS